MDKRVYGAVEWRAIQQYIDEGHGFRACRERFGIAHATWIAAIKRGDLKFWTTGDARCRYNWAEIQAYHDEGHSLRECQARFGFSTATWHEAKLRGKIRPRRVRMTVEEVLATSSSRAHVKRRLLAAGLLDNCCSRCGLREWNGENLSMHIDHINGVKDDHRLENLRMLCPNCHSQTPTYGGRNARRKRGRLQDAA